MYKKSTDNQLIWKDLSGQAERAAQSLDFGKSEELFLLAYEHSKQMFGPDHGEVGLVLMRLAEVCELQGKVQLAAAYREETERIVQSYKLACD